MEDDDSSPPQDIAEEENQKRCSLPRFEKERHKKIFAKEERRAAVRKITAILQKEESERTHEEIEALKEHSDTVSEVRSRWKKRDRAKSRLEEFEDPREVLNQKCQQLAEAIAQSAYLVVYTGAGISTSARIPDYRGPDGIWTRIKQGREIGDHDFTFAEPTDTHMALYELYKKNILKFIVSQNCDGLHLRSGVPRTALSELHGNMYIEVCKNCKPHKEYWRIFDVTENTARYAHKTARKCYVCNEPLYDTIVHFGERGSLSWPLNWKGACSNAKLSTTILCLGSSLKVLKQYSWLWQMDKPAKKRPNLYIVNLQWTPKDDCANLKINGKCDYVIQYVMRALGIEIPKYRAENDPIYFHCTKLAELELHTTTQPFLRKSETPSPVLEESSNSQNKSNRDLYEEKIKIEGRAIYNSYDEVSSTVNINGYGGGFPNSILSNAFSNFFNFNPFLSPYGFRNFETANMSTAPNIFLNAFVQGGSNGSEMFYYPYQTSFLYSGLHSIIRPNFQQFRMTAPAPINPDCKFCYKFQNSERCLFYSPAEPEFVNKQFRYSKLEQKMKINACACCDYSTDEENHAEKEEKQRDEKQLKIKVQPGWFGKGYKKKGRIRKKVKVDAVTN